MNSTSPEHGRRVSRIVKPRTTVTPERPSLREHTSPEQRNWALSKNSPKQDNMFDSVLPIDNTFDMCHTSLSRLSSLSEDVSDSELPNNSVFDHKELDLVLETGFDLGLRQAYSDAPTFASISFFQSPRTSTFAVKVWAAKRPLKPTNMFSNFYHARPFNVGPLPHPTRYR